MSSNNNYVYWNGHCLPPIPPTQPNAVQPQQSPKVEGTPVGLFQDSTSTNSSLPPQVQRSITPNAILRSSRNYQSFGRLVEGGGQLVLNEQSDQAMISNDSILPREQSGLFDFEPEIPPAIVQEPAQVQSSQQTRMNLKPV